MLMMLTIELRVFFWGRVEPVANEQRSEYEYGQID